MKRNLTDLFDFSYCINLDKRIDRWGECTKEFNKWGIKKVKRISALKGAPYTSQYPHYTYSEGNLGLILTNIQILEHAQSQNYSQILIMEDDVCFTPEIEQIENLFTYLPKDWDMVYFGGNNNWSIPGIPQPISVNQHVIKLQHTFTTHCIGIKSSMYPILIDLLKKGNGPIDVLYTVIQKTHNIYGFTPSIAQQREGFSDIQGTINNYSNLIT